MGIASRLQQTFHLKIYASKGEVLQERERRSPCSFQCEEQSSVYSIERRGVSRGGVLTYQVEQ